MTTRAPRTLSVALATLLAGAGALSAALPQSRPNILWLSSEDNGPHLGAYGDTYATTPNLDRLAARGVRYLHAWSTAPVCAPARTTIISGVYPTSTGSQHMRSLVRLPEGMQFFPQLLREAGYYTTNNAKEDYNLVAPGPVWAESSPTAHWRNRPEGHPFFSVFNFGATHESQIRRRPHTPVHDAAKVTVPSYHPDTPEVRRDWAQYYDQLTVMDRQVGERLEELAEDGLAGDTIVFYWGDHGIGLPRGKRTALDTGLRVPLIVYIPEQYRHLAPTDYRAGGASERLVGFVDLAPTVLSLAGIQPPAVYQGHAFLGPYATAPEAVPFLFGFRDRMDERYDLVRAVRDRRYVYARNYLPHRIPGAHVAYMFETPTTQVWRRLYDEGRLPPEQSFFFEPKPSEELYDLEQDPDQVTNLALPEHRTPELEAVLERMRAALRHHLLTIRDLGFLPEAEMLRRARDSTPWELGHSDAYRLEEILELAELASDRAATGEPDLDRLIAALSDPDSALRTWGVIGLIVRGESAVAAARDSLRRLLRDSSPSVRIAAAEALGRHGSDRLARRAARTLLEIASAPAADFYDRVQALDALDALDRRATFLRDEIAALEEPPDAPRRSSRYVERLRDQILEGL